MMKALLSITVATLTSVCVHGFTVDPKNTSDPQLVIEIVDGGMSGPWGQNLIVRKAADRTIVARTSIYSDSMNGLLTESCPIKVLWNDARDRFALFSKINGVEVAMFAYIPDAMRSTGCYFLDGDGRSKTAKDLEGKWLSNTEFLFSFTRPKGKWVERVVMEKEKFLFVPLMINDEPTRTPDSSEPSQSSGR